LGEKIGPNCDVPVAERGRQRVEMRAPAVREFDVEAARKAMGATPDRPHDGRS
jgi:hypothetical protein